MEISSPLHTHEAIVFFESRRHAFLEACTQALLPEDTSALDETLLAFYDAIYLNKPPLHEEVPDALDPLRTSLALAKGWLYLLREAKDEPWIVELIEILTSSKFSFNPPSCTPEACHPKVVSFGEEAGFFLHNTIANIFAAIKENNQPVTFLNLYEGVPIASEGTVVRVEDDEVVFKIDPLQELAMKHDNKAYIVKNQFFSKPIKADILSRDIAQHEVTLTNFVYLLNMPAVQRESARVHPNTVAKVTLASAKGQQILEGILFDLSLGGIGVVSALKHTFLPGDTVNISFELTMPSTQKKLPVALQASIINIIEYDKAYRFCMKFKADPHAKELIGQFVREREEEVIESLKEELKSYYM